MNKKILDTQTKLLRLFRPHTSGEIQATAPVNPTAGGRIGEELNNHDKYLSDYLATWRIGTQEDPIQ